MTNQKSTLFVLVGALALLLTLLPVVASAQPGAACATDMIVQPGDTLSSLAGRHLGNLSAYNLIVEATNARAATDASYARITNPNAIAVGMKLCIPAARLAVNEGGLALAPAPAIQQPLNTPAPSGPPTPIPLPTATPLGRVNVNDLHSLTIEWARGQSYPGSEIVVEQVLTPGSNYQRYLTSYRSEGLKIYALLTVPMGPKPPTGWPAIIFNHGYIPPEQYRTTERYVAYVDGFARNGYIVFRPDYRGHGFSEGEATGGYGTPDYTLDVLNAVAAVKQYPDTDPNRMGMWGHSMGGHITLRSMVIRDDIKVGVIWAGVVASYPDLLNNWRRSTPNPAPPAISSSARRWREVLTREYGTPEENPEFWASISANNYLADISGPIQLHHGTNDDSVPLNFSAWLKEQMDAAGKTAEYYVYQGDNHNLSVNFNTAMARSVEFFDRYLKPRG
jgi:dienelactone hydrolase